MDAQWVAAIAALLSAIATGLAAWAAIKGPEVAARLAERLRSENEAAVEKRRQKLHVFGTIMADRGATYSLDAVRAFNLIDVIYQHSRPVRDAWAAYLDSLVDQIPIHVQREKLRTLLQAMAVDLGLTTDIRPEDLARLYYPKARQKADDILFMQHEALLRNLQGGSTPQANTTTTSTST